MDILNTNKIPATLNLTWFLHQCLVNLNLFPPINPFCFVLQSLNGIQIRREPNALVAAPNSLSSREDIIADVAQENFVTNTLRNEPMYLNLDLLHLNVFVITVQNTWRKTKPSV